MIPRIAQTRVELTSSVGKVLCLVGENGPFFLILSPSWIKLCYRLLIRERVRAAKVVTMGHWPCGNFQSAMVENGNCQKLGDNFENNSSVISKESINNEQRSSLKIFTVTYYQSIVIISSMNLCWNSFKLDCIWCQSFTY